MRTTNILLGLIILIIVGGVIWFGVINGLIPLTPFTLKGEPEKPKIIYHNATADLIKVELPYPGAVVGKEFSVVGEARGNWYFEASFPVEVLDKDGKQLAIIPAQAQSEWMTENFVPFYTTLKIPSTYIGGATLILHKDNPSGLPQNEASISFPITIEY